MRKQIRGMQTLQGVVQTWVPGERVLIHPVLRDFLTYLIIPRGRDHGDFGSWREAASVA